MGAPSMKPRLQRILPRPTIIGLSLIALLLVVNVLISEWNIDRLVENEHRVLHAEEVLTTLETVLFNMTEAETTERGFLITDDPSYLGYYQAAIVKTGETLDRLREITSDEPDQQQRIDALHRRVDARSQELREAIAAQRAGGFTAARQAVSTNRGREHMDEMRKLVRELKEHEQELLALRAAESRHSAYVTHTTDMVGSLMGIGLVGLAFVLYRRDLANRQRAEDAIRRLAAIVECSGDAILGKSLDGVIVSWNAGAERLYGYTAEEMVGQPVTKLCPPERFDEVHRNLQRVRQGIRIQYFETTRIRKGGEFIEVSLSISPIRDAEGNVIGASAIARDVSEQRRLQREVLEIAALEQRRIGQDLHDGTGQELTGLAMMAERLAGELAARKLPESASAAKIVDGLEEALSHVRGLAKGLVPVEVDSEGLMIALSELASRTSDLHGVRCTFECDEPVCILNNQTAMHLYRLSQEAVTNAVKHSRGRNILISLADDGDVVTLTIADDGRGFPNAREPSAGTGLRIMRYRAELIGATLSVGRAQPQGTIVRCLLAHRQATPRPVAAA
jgi:PAS domain S-box-containing protein